MAPGSPTAGSHGHDHGHSHSDDHSHGHSHDDDDADYDPDNDPLRATEYVELTSVGIDVGSATSHLMFSRLGLRRLGHELSSRFVVVSREVVHRSPVHLTPYTHDLRIDDAKLGEYVEDAFRAAGLSPDDVDTGAIILTGEATRRRNARAVADLFAAKSGAFVCATAGHHMEAVLAAHGSGAAALSRDESCRVLNIDIGGGTTKYAVLDRGQLQSSAALHVGGRLVAFDSEGGITRVEPAGQQIAAALGVDWQVGGQAQTEDLERVATWMADAVLQVVGDRPLDDAVRELMLTDGLTGGSYDAVVFSGGVSEYIDQHEPGQFGDIGAHLGQALARRLADLPAPTRPAQRGILATVMGASQYTVQVSGNTIYVSDEQLLPLRNVRVARPDLELTGTIDPEQVAAAIQRHLQAFEISPEEPLALALRWEGAPSFPRLDAFLSGLEKGMAERMASGATLCLVVEGDIGRTLGALLKEERGHPNPVISIDGVTLADFDFVDIGAVLEKSRTVPVSIKSLVFHL